MESQPSQKTESAHWGKQKGKINFSNEYRHILDITRSSRLRDASSNWFNQNISAKK